MNQFYLGTLFGGVSGARTRKCPACPAYANEL